MKKYKGYKRFFYWSKKFYWSNKKNLTKKSKLAVDRLVVGRWLLVDRWLIGWSLVDRLIGWSLVVGWSLVDRLIWKEKNKIYFFILPAQKVFLFFYFIFLFLFLFLFLWWWWSVVFPGVVFFFHAHTRRGGGPGVSMLVPTILTRGKKWNLDKILTKIGKERGLDI